jgi:hypothetical protein
MSRASGTPRAAKLAEKHLLTTLLPPIAVLEAVSTHKGEATTGSTPVAYKEDYLMVNQEPLSVFIAFIGKHRNT